MGLRNKVHNFLQVFRGKVKEEMGKIVKSEELRAEGTSDQRAGNLKQAGEKVRDAFRKR